ncbi:MAG: hypothetical protein M1817_005871 [Caeruleum heppii]|nr:MAG: hypothetical protein M1817_005871 [Caeruleum heppii]
MAPPAGAPAWIEIPAHSVPRAKAFYANLFNFTYRAPAPSPDPSCSPDHMAHIIFPGTREDDMSALSGGICKITSEEGETIMSHRGDEKDEVKHKRVTVYVYVESIDDVLKKVENEGGAVVKPKESEGDHGYCAVVRDPEGNWVGIYEARW